MDNENTDIWASGPRHATPQPRRPHHPMITLLPQPSLHRVPRDLENLFGDASFRGETTTLADIGSSQGITPTGNNGLTMPYQHQPSTATHLPTNTGVNDDNLGSLYQSLSKDARIGLIVGIVVIISLTLLGCGMCFLDCRKRQRSRKARRESRDTELTMLEMEMRNGQADPQRRERNGLWDHLRPAGDKENGDDTDVASRNARDPMRQDSTIDSTRSEISVGSSRAHETGDKASVVSSVPSLAPSAGGRAVLPRSFLDDAVRS